MKRLLATGVILFGLRPDARAQSNVGDSQTADWHLQASLQYTPEQTILDEDFSTAGSIAEAPTLADQIDVLKAERWIASPSEFVREPLRLDINAPNVRTEVAGLKTGIYVIRSGPTGVMGLVPRGEGATLSFASPPVLHRDLAITYEFLVPNALDGIHVSLYATCVDTKNFTLLDDVEYVPQITREGTRHIGRHFGAKNPCKLNEQVLFTWKASAGAGVSAGFLSRISIIGAAMRPTIAYTTVVGDDKSAPYLRNAFAAAIRAGGLYNVVTCKDDAIDEESLVKPIAERGWVNTTQSGDRGELLAKLTAAGCRLPPSSRIFAARLAVDRDHQSNRGELVVILRDLEHPYLTPMSFGTRIPENGKWSWEELLRQALWALHGSLYDFAPEPHIHLESWNSKVSVALTAGSISPARSVLNSSLYLVLLSCRNRSADCEENTARARLAELVRECRLPHSSTRSREEYANEVECLISQLRGDGLHVEHEGHWTNWPSAPKSGVEVYPVGRPISYSVEGVLGVVAVGIAMSPLGKWNAESSALNVADSHFSLRVASGYRYTRYIGDSFGSGERHSIGDAFAEMSLLTSPRFTWQFGMRAGVAAGNATSTDNRLGIWGGLQANVAAPLVGRLRGSIGLSADYGSARFVGPHASLLLGMPLHIWHSITPHTPEFERGEMAFDLVLEPSIDASFGYAAGARASIGLMRSF